MNAGQNAQVDGHGNIIVQAAGDGVHVTVGQPHLTLIPPYNRVPSIQTEIDLLNPYRRAIDLVGREQDMTELWDWLHSPRTIAIRTITGRAGAGKTRAAIELIERLNSDQSGGWWAGFLQGSELHRFAAQQNLADWGWSRSTLIVIDYAASLVSPLRAWLRDLAQNSVSSESPPLRLLLLEREAAQEEGWLQALCLGGYSEAGVPGLFDPLEPKRLHRLGTMERRREVLERMHSAAARIAQCDPPKLPAPGENVRFDRQLENRVWEDPLYLMMAALLSLQSDLTEVLDLPRTELALRLVDHEIKRLEEGVSSEAEKRLLVHLAAFASLGGGLTQDIALDIAEEEMAALKLTCPEGPGALVSRLHDVLPAPDHGLAPVTPDILAEALALRAMERCAVAQQKAAIHRAVQKLGRRVVSFAVRTVQDFTPAGRTEPLNWLEHLISAGVTDDLGLLVQIETAMPEHTLSLREKAAEVDELLAERLAELAKEDPSEPNLAEYGRLLNNLANRLSELGRREEALAKAQEAVRIREQLAEARPDAFLPDLAMSCGARGMVLTEMGRRGDAADSFKQGVAALKPLFLRSPAVFRDLIGRLVRDYIQSSQSAGQAPDMALLEPVVEVFEKLAQKDTKE